MEYARLAERPLAARFAGQLTVVEFSRRKIINDELEGYLANLELAKRPHRTVQSKRRFLTTFLSIVHKKFAGEFRRDDGLILSNRLMQKYTPKSVDTMMMCVVMFFNRWLKVNLGMEASDWPHCSDSDPQPNNDEEIIVLEKCTTSTTNKNPARWVWCASGACCLLLGCG